MGPDLPGGRVVPAAEDAGGGGPLGEVSAVGVGQATGAGVKVTRGGDDFVTDVIQCLSENRIPVTEFRTILPNLEDVFLKLTGHSIRD